MAKFKLERKVDLSDTGEGWKGAYISFSDLTVGMIEKLTKSDVDENEQYTVMLTIIEDLFVDGKGWDGKELVPIKKEDIRELPFSIIQKVSDFLSPEPTEKQQKYLDSQKG